MESMEWYLPILIFFARIGDVSVGTIRLILVVQGLRWQAAILGFFEVVIWVLAVGGVIQNLTNLWALLGYAGGFAVGNLVGIWLEGKIAIGHRVVRVLRKTQEPNLCASLRAKGYGCTRVDAEGRDGPVELLFLVVRRRFVPKLLRDIDAVDPNSFITIERTDLARGDLFRKASPLARRAPWHLRMLRK